MHIFLFLSGNPPPPPLIYKSYTVAFIIFWPATRPVCAFQGSRPFLVLILFTCSWCNIQEGSQSNKTVHLYYPLLWLYQGNWRALSQTASGLFEILKRRAQKIFENGCLRLFITVSDGVRVVCRVHFEPVLTFRHCKSNYT